MSLYPHPTEIMNYKFSEYPDCSSFGTEPVDMTCKIWSRSVFNCNINLNWLWNTWILCIHKWNNGTFIQCRLWIKIQNIVFVLVNVISIIKLGRRCIYLIEARAIRVNFSLDMWWKINYWLSLWVVSFYECSHYVTATKKLIYVTGQEDIFYSRNV